MKARLVRLFLVFGVAIAAISQDDKPADQKHIPASGGSWRNVTLAASSIERGVSYPSVIQLKGNVQIKLKGMILRAEEATFREGTGEIEARGNVRIVPYPVIEETAPGEK